MLISKYQLRFIALLASLLCALPTAAQQGPDPTLPGPLREVGFRQELGAQLPLPARFMDENGEAVALGDYFRERPVIIALVYYECPQLCNMVLNGVFASLEVVARKAGKDFDLVVVSFDPGEGPQLAATKKANYLRQYEMGGESEGIHFLTGQPEDIEALTTAVGFDYAYDEDSDEFAHASGIVVASPSGVVTRYLYGIDYPPKDLRLALAESADGKISSPVDQLLLFCYRYDPTLGKYSLAIMNLVRGGAVLTVLALLVFFLKMRRHDRATANPDQQGMAT